MKKCITDVDIIDTVKKVIRESGVLKEVKGKLCEQYPKKAKEECVCVFCVSSLASQVESAYVVVNILVGDIYNDKTKQEEWDKARLRYLSPLFKNVLSSYSKDGWHIKLESQHIEQKEDLKAHIITNRLFVKYVNC